MCVYIYIGLSRCTSVVGGQVSNVLVFITFLNNIIYIYISIYVYIYVYI